VIAGRHWRNLPPIFILSIFVLGNLIFHIQDYRTSIAEFGTGLGIAGRLPGPFDRFDKAVLPVSVLALVL
jgi:hypothetical protein